MTILPAKDFLSLSRQRTLFKGRPRLRILLLVAVIVAIFGWQGTFRDAAGDLDDGFKISNSYGGQMSDLAYFYHYLGLFPIHTLENPRPTATPEAAAEAIKTRGAELVLAETYDRLTLLSYLPDIFMGGDPYAPKHNTGAWLGFMLALAALYTAFWTARLELLGIVVIALVGSDPFQLHEIYKHDNVFGWVINIGLLATAINLPLIVNHRYYLTRGGPAAAYLWVAPVLTGGLLGMFRHLRTECVTTLVATLAVYAFLSGVSIRRKVSVIAILIMAYGVSNVSWSMYFDRLSKQAVSVVVSNGGTVNSSYGDQRYHPFWHPLWGGFGDFDGKYGYLFWDRVITDYAAPIVATRPDANPDVHIRLTKAYGEVLRDKIIHDIVNDPVWYGTIIVKRLHRAIMENTPLRLSLGARWIDIPVSSLVTVPLGLLAILCYLWRREWSMPRLMLYPFAIGGVSIAVTSINGYHYYMLLHLFLSALLVGLALELLLRTIAARGKTETPSLSPAHHNLMET